MGSENDLARAALKYFSIRGTNRLEVWRHVAKKYNMKGERRLTPNARPEVTESDGEDIRQRHAHDHLRGSEASYILWQGGIALLD